MNFAVFIIYVGAELVLIALLLLVAYFSLNGIFTVPWVRTKKNVTQAMFELAQVKEGETVVDYGSGDGSVVLDAAEKGAHGIGIERLRLLVWFSKLRAKNRNTSGTVRFIQGNMFDLEPPHADVVFLYLFPEFNKRLEPIFLKHYPSGTRIVTRDFLFPNLPLIATKNIEDTKLNFYKIP